MNFRALVRFGLPLVFPVIVLAANLAGYTNQFVAGVLVGGCLVWLGLAFITFRPIQKRFPEIAALLRGRWATQEDLTGPYVRNRVFRIADACTTANEIDNKTFEDCEIWGPGVLIPEEYGQIVECTFGDPRQLWKVHPEAEAAGVVGPIRLRRCNFRRCTFRGIGITGPTDAVDRWREGIKSG